jgi:hypothetical protein
MAKSENFGRHLSSPACQPSCPCVMNQGNHVTLQPNCTSEASPSHNGAKGTVIPCSTAKGVRATGEQGNQSKASLVFHEAQGAQVTKGQGNRETVKQVVQDRTYWRPKESLLQGCRVSGVTLQELAVSYQSASASLMTRFRVIGLQIRLYLRLNA